MHTEVTDMTSRYRTIGAIVVSVTILAAAFARIHRSRLPSDRHEIQLQTSESWNGKPYKHDSMGRSQATAIKLANAPNTAQPEHTHPFLEVAPKRASTSTPHIEASDKAEAVHRSQAEGEPADDVHRDECNEGSDDLPITYVGTQAF